MSDATQSPQSEESAKEKRKPELSRLEFNRAELAKLLGVTGPTITNAVDAGAPVKDRGSKGKSAVYDGPAFLAWWVENEKRKAREEGGSKKLATQDQELEVEIKREKLAQMRKENVPRAAFGEVLRDVFTRAGIALDRIPTRHADKVIALPDEISAVAALTKIVAEVKAELRAPREWAAPSELQEDAAA